MELQLSQDSRTTAGIILLTLVAVELGGLAVLRIVLGKDERTAFQTAFERAGHAHAGVLLILALVGQVLADAADLSGAADWLARNCIWLAAVLILLVYAGAIVLGVGVVTLGIGLLCSTLLPIGA